MLEYGSYVVFQYTSPHGEECWLYADFEGWHYFNTPPRTGRNPTLSDESSVSSISIHLPARGGIPTQEQMKKTYDFNTPPRTGRNI